MLDINYLFLYIYIYFLSSASYLFPFLGPDDDWRLMRASKLPHMPAIYQRREQSCRFIRSAKWQNIHEMVFKKKGGVILYTL